MASHGSEPGLEQLINTSDVVRSQHPIWTGRLNKLGDQMSERGNGGVRMEGWLLLESRRGPRVTPTAPNPRHLGFPTLPNLFSEWRRRFAQPDKGNSSAGSDGFWDRTSTCAREHNCFQPEPQQKPHPAYNGWDVGRLLDCGKGRAS